MQRFIFVFFYPTQTYKVMLTNKMKVWDIEDLKNDKHAIFHPKKEAK